MNRSNNPFTGTFLQASADPSFQSRVVVVGLQDGVTPIEMRLVSLRDDTRSVAGDYRCLYLAWLKAVSLLVGWSLNSAMNSLS